MKKHLLLYVISFVLAGAAYGQANEGIITNRSAMEVNFAQSLWANSSNAAGLVFNPLYRYNIVSGFLDYEKGDYKLQQSGDSQRRFGFNTNGALRLGKMALWGDFTFSDNHITGATYNTNLNNPRPDMPFYIADPNKSDWRRQSYDMAVKAAFPIGDQLSFGVEINYLTMKGAKQLDPRGTVLSYFIDVHPSFVYKIGDNHYAGVRFQYNNSFDRTSFRNSLSFGSQQIFIMRGLGNFTRGMVGGSGGNIGVFYYNGNGWGGGLQYGFMGDHTDVLFDLSYDRRMIETFETPTAPRQRGDADNTTLSGNVQLLRKGSVTHKATLHLVHSATDGIEYVQEYVPDYGLFPWLTVAKYIKSTYKQLSVSLQYDAFIGTHTDYDWKLGLNAAFSDQQDEYILPYSEFNARGFSTGFHAGKNFTLCSSSKLLLGVNCGYRKNLDGNYSYNGMDSESVIVTDFYAKDLAFHTADTWQTGCNLDFSFVLKSISSINAGLRWNMVHAPSLSENRNMITASFAYIF